MASVSRDENGTKRICFTGADGKRQSVRLGKASVKTAESFRLRVEALLEHWALQRPLDGELSAWVGGLPDRTHDRLARCGLVEPRASAAVVTVGELLERFESAASVKASTRAAYKQTTDSLRAVLGSETALGSVTAETADQWRKAIAEPRETVRGTRKLSPATISKRVHVAKAIFSKAVRWGLIPTSPFAGLRAGSQANPERAHYVSHETARAILEACPGREWRAIVALSRYAGLRCPSEIAGLRWGDVNWERGRLTVRSPKTAGHEGHAVRQVPIDGKLRPILQSLFDAAEVGTERVVPRLSDATANLRTTFTKIIARAGETPWPRLFHNMRASCATDWAERFPPHAVANWLGHSPLVAAQHYLQTRDAHFDLAAGIVSPESAVRQSGAKCGALTVQNAAQHPSARDRAPSHDHLLTPDVQHGCATSCETAQPRANRSSGRRGIRTPCCFLRVSRAEAEAAQKAERVALIGPPQLRVGAW